MQRPTALVLHAAVRRVGMGLLNHSVPPDLAHSAAGRRHWHHACPGRSLRRGWPITPAVRAGAQIIRPLGETSPCR
jgi:hypothetical protein